MGNSTDELQSGFTEGYLATDSSVRRPSALFYDSSGLSRIMNLSDGVFSIVITLLAFDIKLPALEPGVPLTAALWGLLPRVCTFVVTFLLVGIYWVGHHAIFRHICRYDRGFLWVNIIFLMWVAMLPFPNAVVGSYPNERSAVWLYGLAICGTGASLSWLWRYATDHHRLVEPSLSAEVISLGHRRILLAPALAFASMVLALWSTTASITIFLCCAALYFLPSRIDTMLHR